MFTGADKNNATSSASSTTQPYSAYRFNAMRWDGTSGQYDMGFRNYDPGLNQFTSRDMYNGATQNTGLTADPFTGSAYAFGGGNPISNIENDGHMACAGTATSQQSDCSVQGGPEMAPSSATTTVPSCSFIQLSCASGPPLAAGAAVGAAGAAAGGAGRAQAPTVSNQKLQSILNDLYARDRAGSVTGDGTAYQALLEELRTGNQVGGKWHAQKVADLFNRFSNLLEANRKAQLSGDALLSEQDQKIAYSWTGKLWQALNMSDATGNVAAAIKSSSQMRDGIVRAINNGRTYAVRNITGDTFTQTPKGSYARDAATAEDPVVEGGGLAESLGILDIALPVLVDPSDPLMGVCKMTPGCQQMLPSPVQQPAI